MTVATFNSKAPGIMRKLMDDFNLDVESAAAILGNLGHESGGLTSLQEISPTVTGSRGGYGWAQWTGPRRRQYEAYCERNHLNPASDGANYAFLYVELSGAYSNAITAVKKPGTLRQKVERFEEAYEKAGVKGYASREKWAKRALDAYRANPPKATKPSSPTKTAAKTGGWLAVLYGCYEAIINLGHTHPWLVSFGVAGVIIFAMSIHTLINKKEENVI